MTGTWEGFPSPLWGVNNLISPLWKLWLFIYDNNLGYSSQFLNWSAFWSLFNILGIWFRDDDGGTGWSCRSFPTLILWYKILLCVFSHSKNALFPPVFHWSSWVGQWNYCSWFFKILFLTFQSDPAAVKATLIMGPSLQNKKILLWHHSDGSEDDWGQVALLASECPNSLGCFEITPFIFLATFAILWVPQTRCNR